MSEKHDVFVGNLTFNTTEDQLRKMFEFIGPVKSVRILQDKETGKPKGFAFVEYYDMNCALTAIRQLDQAELNSRKIKVGFPTQSNLRDVARQHGHIIKDGSGESANVAAVPITTAQLEYRKKVEQEVISNLKLHEAWDMLDAMKTMIMNDKRGTKVKAILEAHPQLVNAMYEIQKRLGIVLPVHIQQQRTLLLQQAAAVAVTEVPSSLPPPPMPPNLPAPPHGITLPPPPPRPPTLVGKAAPSSVAGKGYHNQPYSSAPPTLAPPSAPVFSALGENIDLNALVAHITAGGEIPADLDIGLLSSLLSASSNNNIPAAPTLTLPPNLDDGGYGFTGSDSNYQDYEDINAASNANTARKSRFN